MSSFFVNTEEVITVVHAGNSVLHVCLHYVPLVKFMGLYKTMVLVHSRYLYLAIEHLELI